VKIEVAVEPLIVWPDLGCRGDHVKQVAADHRIAGELVALFEAPE
jgi:hypothetical protein